MSAGHGSGRRTAGQPARDADQAFEDAHRVPRVPGIAAQDHVQPGHAAQQQDQPSDGADRQACRGLTGQREDGQRDDRESELGEDVEDLETSV